MKRNFLILFLLLGFSFCYSQVKKDTSNNEVDAYIKMATQWRYVVIAGASSDYNALDISAKQISKTTSIPYDTIHENDGRIIPKDTLKYDYDAGQYMPRRSEENLISIEMMYCYTEYTANIDKMKMIIITGIFDNKEDADRQLKQIQKSVPTAYVKKTELFMGCTH